MAVKKVILKTTEKHQNQRLDQFLADLLPAALDQPLSKAKVRKLIVAGAVYLNGRRSRIASKPLLPHVRVEAYVDLHKLNSHHSSGDVEFTMTQERVLYEDDDLIAVDKPPYLPTQPTLDEARNNLFAAVKKFLTQRAQRTQKSGATAGSVYLGMHHRLDRDTSGIILFTKSQRVNPGIAKIFSSRLATKTYQALALGSKIQECPKMWTIKNYMGSLGRGKNSRYGTLRSGGDFAHTDFQLIQQLGECLHIEASLHTGRTHQIRVHLSEAGMPLLGDTFYGGPTLVNGIAIPRVMLHAMSLTFPHPIHQNRISIRCEIPGDFSQCALNLKNLENLESLKELGKSQKSTVAPKSKMRS
jgi:23S rRNA pseudouridine1911/1915/1917 synthase